MFVHHEKAETTSVGMLPVYVTCSKRLQMHVTECDGMCMWHVQAVVKVQDARRSLLPGVGGEAASY